MRATGDEADDVGGVDEEDRTDLVGDCAERTPVDEAGVGRVTGDDHLGLVLLGETEDLVEVDHLRFRVDSISNEIVVLAGEVDRGPVGEVTALVEAHPQDGVSRLQQGQVGTEVGR